jgi:hypothetical protein
MYWDAAPGMKGTLQSLGTRMFMSRFAKRYIAGMRKLVEELPQEERAAAVGS